MFVIRPAKLEDIEALKEFAENAALGIISLPKNPELLKKKIAFSLSCFDKQVQNPGNEIYCFVLENLETGEVGGCCAIYAKTGIKEPVYIYRLETSYPSSKTLPVPGQITVLKPMKLSNGPAELSMLFLKKEWRKEKLGELLSLSRFLFIANHRDRIETTICARLRGVLDPKKNTSPFWDGIGRHFVAIDFSKVCELQQEDYPYIEEFLPRFPIYTHLLSKQVQAMIGRIHETTRPALHMLKKEGMSLSSDIDLFDGGPILQGDISTIRTVVKSRRTTVAKVDTVPINSPLFLISNCLLDFRCCFARALFKEREGITLAYEDAKALQVSPGDDVRFIPNKLQE